MPNQDETVDTEGGEFAVLSQISAELSAEHLSGEDDLWVGSPFAWIRREPSRTRGKIGEELVERWVTSRGAKVERSDDSDADRLINGRPVEVKMSTLWESGIYKFQQIRDQSYEYLIALGISPHEAHCWVLGKDLLEQHVIGKLGQHTGDEGDETAWISFEPQQPLPWMEGTGGSLEAAWDLIEAWGS